VPTLLPNGRIRIVYLRTLGHPALLGTDGMAVHKLRKKDLALLVYLCVEGAAVHSRGRLASLLWGESPEDLARHSLTQALSRLGKVLPPGSLVAANQVVRWEGELPCDAAVLLRGGLGPADVDDEFSVYEGDFLRGFHPGPGAEEFCEWAERRGADLRNAMLRLLELAGADAEEKGRLWRTVKLAEKAVRIDPLAENARRRLMRAWAALGERNIALRHYHDFADWLSREMGADPDPDTRALADRLRAEPADPSHPPAPVRRDPAPPAGPSPPPVVPPAAIDPPPPATQEVEPDPPPEPPAAAPDDDGEAWGAGIGVRDGAPRETASGGGAPPQSDGAAPPPPLRTGTPWMAIGGLLVAAMVLALWMRLRTPPVAPEPVGHGESLRERGGVQVYLAFAGTLYAYPDTATLRACTGLRTPAIRQVRSLPPWPRVGLPSVRWHPWMGDTVPVVTDDPALKPAYVATGCVLAPVPDPSTLDSIFGAGALGRMLEVPHAVLQAMPRAFIARGHPVRPAGTLVRSPQGIIRWITYHGGALEVEDPAVLATWCRSPGEAVDVSATEFGHYRPFARLHSGEADCR
jgi:DNA-binding SARP family transcriptional activator